MNNSVIKSKKIEEFIDEHITEELSLDIIAENFEMSRHHLCHLFKKNMGCTVLQYIKHKRLCFVKNCYISGLNLLDAAKLAGFKSYSSFYRAYYSEFGKSPSKDIDSSENK